MPLINYSLLLLLLLLKATNLVSCFEAAKFTLRDIRLCLEPEHLLELELKPGRERECSFRCSAFDRCQGFRLLPESRLCQLFVFDRCSNFANTIGPCPTVRAYVKKYNGLPDGQLCPSSYGQKYGTSVYKLLYSPDWNDGLAKCNSQPGLVKAADANDLNETVHFHWIKTHLNHDIAYFLGGNRIGDSIWVWEACNTTFAADIWTPGQPDGDGTKASIWSSVYGQTIGVNDVASVSVYANKTLCECVDPFQ